MTVSKDTAIEVYISVEEIEWLLRVMRIAKPETEDRTLEEYFRNVVKEYGFDEH